MASASDIMRHDQMRFGFDGGLDVVSDHAIVAGAGVHGAGIGIGQGNPTILCIGQYSIHRLQVLDVLADAAIAFGQMRDLLGLDLAFFLSIDANHLGDVAFDVSLQMGDAVGNRRDPVQVAVYEQLEQNGGMVAGANNARRCRPHKPEVRQIKLCDKEIDHPNQMILTDPVLEPIGEKDSR